MFVVAALFLSVQLVTLLSNLVFFPVLQPAPNRGGGAEQRGGSVSILIPVRNEAQNLPETLPRILEQEGVHEVIVLDDGSTDETGAMLRYFQREAPRLRVLDGRPLPAGWSGKNWACQQLSQVASGDILIFTDADVRWEADTLRALLAFRERHRADFVSVWPRQLTPTLAERLSVPAIDLILLGSLPYLGVTFLPLAAFAAGNGQLMLWTREGYGRVGGHAAFRAEVLEDVRMGQRAKGLKLRVALALGGSVISTRMYRSEAEILEGFSKNILAAVGGNRLVLVLLSLLNTLTYTLSWVFALFNSWWLLIALLGTFQRALTCLKTRRSPFEAFLQPLMAFPLWRVTLRALRPGSYSWKGRSYSR